MSYDIDNGRVQPPAPLAGEMFADAGARAVWAAVVQLEEASKHQLLGVLVEHLAAPEARVNPQRARVARAIAALHEAARHCEDGLSRDAYDELRRRNAAAGWPSTASVCRWLGGTWNDALRRAGLSEVFNGDAVIRELGPAFTREECVRAVLDYVADTGDRLAGCHAVLAWAKRPDVRARPGHRPRSLGPYQRLFAGWAQVLAACELIDGDAATGAAIGTTGYGSLRPAKAYGYSEEQLFAAMREVAGRLGRSAKTQEYIREREVILAEDRAAERLPRAFPTYNVIQTRYATWDEALCAAGLEPVRGRQNELYPEVVDGPEDEGGVPSRLIKTDRRKAEKEGTPWMMFAGSPSGRTTRSRSRWTTSRVRAPAG